MDDFNAASLQESRNEWISRLINIITPLIVEGFKSIYTESYKMCLEADEEDKYLMTFQNFISRIPKWNEELIQNEVKRISEKSSCGYIEDLITCVHVIQLKVLTCVRVGQKQKKIEINIPKLKDFIHKVYIHVARKLYTNIYLFEANIPPLQVQKNNREFEIIIKECIVNAVRETIPVEHILRSYLEESVEDEVEAKETLIETKLDVAKEEMEEKQKIDNIIQKVKKENNIVLKTNDNIQIDETVVPVSLDIDEISENGTNTAAAAATVGGQTLKFSDIDKMIDENKKEQHVTAPKTIERLESISNQRNESRKLEEMSNMDDDDEKIKIFDESVQVAFEDLGAPNKNADDDLIVLDGIEIL